MWLCHRLIIYDMDMSIRNAALARLGLDVWRRMSWVEKLASIQVMGSRYRYTEVLLSTYTASLGYNVGKITLGCNLRIAT